MKIFPINSVNAVIHRENQGIQITFSDAPKEFILEFWPSKFGTRVQPVRITYRSSKKRRNRNITHPGQLEFVFKNQLDERPAGWTQWPINTIGRNLRLVEIFVAAFNNERRRSLTLQFRTTLANGINCAKRAATSVSYWIRAALNLLPSRRKKPWATRQADEVRDR